MIFYNGFNFWAKRDIFDFNLLAGTMEGVKKFLETDGVYGEAAPDDPTGVKRKDELWFDS